ncbi:osmotically inducible protein C [bacterium]|nr:osmotically inducible protein C [bacterium]
MQSVLVTYSNQNNEVYPAQIELPIDRHPHNFVLLAHCFLKKNEAHAVQIISHYLSRAGFGIMRVDMTGTGESIADYEGLNTKDKSPDIEAAISFLAENYQKPTVVVGHSFGGNKLIELAGKIDSLRAICTIGASEAHKDTLLRLQKPLLMFHSQKDQEVPFEQALDIFTKSSHPKSLITLEHADHFLSHADDARYVGEMLAAWALRYVKIPEEKPIATDQQVGARLGESGYTTEIQIGRHHLIADEPADLGGNNFGPNPYELVSSGLAACTAITLRMYAKVKNWNLTGVEVYVSHAKKHCPDCDDPINTSPKIDEFIREIKLEGELDDKQRKRMLEIANRCPVHKTLHSEVRVISSLV